VPRIHFLHTGAVARELQRGTMDSNTTFRYLAVLVLECLFIAYYRTFWMGPPDGYSIVEAFLVLVVSAYGLRQCYLANAHSAGDHLTERFIVLAVPLTLKLALGFELVIRVIYFNYSTLASSLSDDAYELTWRLFNSATSVFFAMIWFWRMRKWLTVSSSNAGG